MMRDFHMKNHCLQLLAAASCVVALSQCQSPSGAGYPIVDQRKVTVKGRQFLETRVLVSEIPRETQFRSVELR